MKNIVAARKWETSDGSMHINSVNFVCKCNFSKHIANIKNFSFGLLKGCGH